MKESQVSTPKHSKAAISAIALGVKLFVFENIDIQIRNIES
jgi:hypothetical protein